MRRLVCVVLTLGVLAAPPAAAEEEPLQQVEGSIAATATGPEPARDAWLRSDGRVNGVQGYVFTVDPSTIPGHYDVHVTAPSIGGGPVGITFYSDFAAGTVCHQYQALQQFGWPCGTHAVVWSRDRAPLTFEYTARAGYQRGSVAGSVPQIPNDPAVAMQLNAAHSGSIGATPSTVARPFGRAWETELSYWGTPSYPIIAGGRVFASVTPDAADGSDVVALDAATGQEVWRKRLEHMYSSTVLTYGGGNLYVVDPEGLLRALDPATGTIRWTRQFERSDAEPTPYGDLLYVATSDQILALNALDGSTVWSHPALVGYSTVTPAVDETGVYIATQCQIQRLNPLNGEVVWSVRPPLCGHNAKLALQGLRLYLTYPTDDQDVVMRTTDGEIIREYDTGFLPSVSPLGAVEIRSGNQLTAVDETTGRARWAYDNSVEVYAPLTVAGAVYYLTRNGLSVLDVGSGELLYRDARLLVDSGWSYKPHIGMAAGEGLLVVPTDSGLVAYRNQ